MTVMSTPASQQASWRMCGGERAASRVLAAGTGSSVAARGGVLGDQPLEGVAAERRAAAGGEQRRRPGCPAALGEPGAQDRARSGVVSGVIALFAALAVAADVGAGAEVGRLRGVRPVSSEARSPVWMASSSRAWSRRPVQVARSGAASRASISAAVR